MCIAAWIWQAHPVYPFLLLLNRDEFHDRLTKPLGWWGEGPNKILGGRDLIGGGTWLGCTKDGKLAFLTNVLEPDADPNARTRGDLPVRFLQGNKSPLEYAKEVAKEAGAYNGFNLILADLCKKSMIYVSNRLQGKPAVQVVPPGLHVLTNAALDSPWQKAIRLGKNFSDVLLKHDDEDVIPKDFVEMLMKDTTKCDRDMLPKTGCDSDFEFDLSSIFVEIKTKQGTYGTRSTAVISLRNSGDVSFYEKYIENGIWKDHTVRFHIE
ncbi:hypothetical protein LUZ60_007054 [Juncus effusus]|nr:hypothetical protein LUZ60_007054 [Juncus effusus]